MAEKKSSSVAVWVTTFILAAVFVLAGASNFSNSEQMKKIFYNWGYPDWFRILIGVLEITAGVLLLFPKTASLAAFTLACIMLGATATHLRNDTLMMAVFPALFFISLSSLAYYRFPQKTPPV